MATKNKDELIKDDSVNDNSVNDPVAKKQPRLGDMAKVLGNKAAPPRIDGESFYPTDKPIEVKVTTRVIKLLRDGDLTLA